MLPLLPLLSIARGHDSRDHTIYQGLSGAGGERRWDTGNEDGVWYVPYIVKMTNNIWTFHRGVVQLYSYFFFLYYF
jgi:hypothetical protein